MKTSLLLDRTHPDGWQYVPVTENDGQERDTADAHINPAALSPDHQSDNIGDDIPVDV